MTLDMFMLIAISIAMIAVFTNFFGLGSYQRGTWYEVSYDELDTTMKKLYALKAFNDSDGIPQEQLKVKAFVQDGQVCYLVRVPKWIFKNVEIELTEAKRRELIGLTP